MHYNPKTSNQDQPTTATLHDSTTTLLLVHVSLYNTVMSRKNNWLFDPNIITILIFFLRKYSMEFSSKSTNVLV